MPHTPPTSPLAVAPEILTVGDGGRYATVTAALAAASSGDVVWVAPGTYAENVTIPDGVTLHFAGYVTLGTGAGPAVTIASPGTGEIAFITGSGLLSGTASILAAAGAILALDPSIIIGGTVSGVYRRGDKIVLQSGEAIATYCPADGSLCAVNEGSELYDGNTGVTLTAMNHGGTVRWLTDSVAIQINPNGTETSTSGYWLGYHPESYETALVESWRGAWEQTNSTTATNYFDFLLTFLGVTLASWSTQNLADDEWLFVNETINAVININGGGTDLVGTADTNGSQGFKVTVTENGTQVMRHSMVIWVRGIAA